MFFFALICAALGLVYMLWAKGLFKLLQIYLTLPIVQVIFFPHLDITLMYNVVAYVIGAIIIICSINCFNSARPWVDNFGNKTNLEKDALKEVMQTENNS